MKKIKNQKLKSIIENFDNDSKQFLIYLKKLSQLSGTNLNNLYTCVSAMIEIAKNKKLNSSNTKKILNLLKTNFGFNEIDYDDIFHHAIERAVEVAADNGIDGADEDAFAEYIDGEYPELDEDQVEKIYVMFDKWKEDN